MFQLSKRSSTENSMLADKETSLSNEVSNSRVKKSSYETKLRKMTSHSRVTNSKILTEIPLSSFNFIKF